jgi:hypothetical protein
LGKEKIVSRRHHGQGTMDTGFSMPSRWCTRVAAAGFDQQQQRNSFGWSLA